MSYVIGVLIAQVVINFLFFYLIHTNNERAFRVGYRHAFALDEHSTKIAIVAKEFGITFSADDEDHIAAKFPVSMLDFLAKRDLDVANRTSRSTPTDSV